MKVKRVCHPVEISIVFDSDKEVNELYNRLMVPFEEVKQAVGNGDTPLLGNLDDVLDDIIWNG